MTESARTQQVSYYDHPSCSNSALSALKRELSAQDQYEYKEALAVGTLVDAMLTDPTAIDLILRTVNGKPYTEEQWKIACRCRDAFNANYVCRSILQGSELQVEIYSDMEFEWEGLTFTLPFKSKLDGLKRTVRMAWDLKSTAAKSQAEFEAYVDRLDYDRSAAVYMRMADCDRFLIIGVSKQKNPQIYFVVVERGDWWHMSGENKLIGLAYQYYMLKHNAA